jgi:PPK2 family polyphosphate:nucleotide phosphotransferase
MVDIAKKCLVTPESGVRIADFNPAETFGLKKEDADMKPSLDRLAELQNLLYADARHALLIVLQAMDAGGKDGTIRHVMSGVNPQGCEVTSFKVPSTEEKAHDFLWRIHKAVPKLGYIGIFNRSQYEDVLVVRVHKLLPKSVWRHRYAQINAFERILTLNKVTILKFFLNISKEEQKRRFEQRLTDPSKEWKLSLPDFEERKQWDKYMRAYQTMLRKCSTDWAPWYVIPGDHKWFRNYAVAEIIVKTLAGMDLKYPQVTADLSKLKIPD